MMKWILYLKFLLFPFAIVYGGTLYIRNFLFRIHILKSKSFDIPLIGIGNIAVGGTGKTPMAEYLIRLLHKDFKTGYLSRGYRRKSSGFVYAGESTSPDQIGDEACMINSRFYDLEVAVDEKRVRGVEQILQIRPGLQTIILDDVFQHRYINPGLKILLTDFNNPLYKDFLMPVGMLREYKRARKRADIIMVTKCPESLSKKQREEILLKIRANRNQKVFFTGLSYGEAISLEGNIQNALDNQTNVFLITGIASPKTLIAYLKGKIKELNTLIFPDHHHFSNRDMKRIEEKMKELKCEDSIIITTEKDAVKIRSLEGIPAKILNNIYVLPVKMSILFDEEAYFDQLVQSYVRENLPK